MKILESVTLVESHDTKIVRIKVQTPHIAQKAQPGQFVVCMAKKEGERSPLTIVDKDSARGAITLIIQEAGLTTKLLGELKEGDSLYAIVGPLGHATEIKKYGRVILLGGGVGIAEIYPVARALKEAGNHITTIVGARTKSLFILEEELKHISDTLHVTTDDGSYGQKGFVTEVLKSLLTHDAARTTSYDLIYAVGPIPMMRSVALATKDSGIRTVVSLNALMVDGTGMCGCCRVTVGGKTFFTCIDGPEFDAHLVDWKELTQRNSVYEDKEKHICKLYAHDD